MNTHNWCVITTFIVLASFYAGLYLLTLYSGFARTLVWMDADIKEALERREKLQSFAGYPLLHKGRIIGVVGMFSEKKLSPAQFEMLGIFCDHISKEISMLYDIGEFLSIR